jgi:hypothetical protein
LSIDVQCPLPCAALILCRALMPFFYRAFVLCRAFFPVCMTIISLPCGGSRQRLASRQRLFSRSVSYVKKSTISVHVAKYQPEDSASICVFYGQPWNDDLLIFPVKSLCPEPHAAETRLCLHWNHTLPILDNAFIEPKQLYETINRSYMGR